MPFLDRLSGGVLHARVQQAFSARAAALTGWNAGAFSPCDFYRPSHEIEAMPPAMPGCGAPGCKTGWLKPWKARRRPLFEGSWTCSGRCLNMLVRTLVRREMSITVEDAAPAPHRHRMPLGLVLLAQGWITHTQLQVALEAQRSSGRGRIGDWLIECCGLSPEKITRGLGVQWNCPVLSLDGFSPAAMALAIPPVLAAAVGAVPVRTAGSTLLYVAMQGSTNAAAAFAIERMSGLRVESGLLGDNDFLRARTALREADAVPLHRSTVQDADALCAAMASIIEQRQPIASRMVRMKNFYWLRLWLESGARSGVGDLPPDSQDVEDHLFCIGANPVGLV